jgi:hypothetical protein
MASSDDKNINILSLTDCLHFTNGNCIFKSKCRYRHCQTAANQLEKCRKWPNSCRNMDCPFRHPSGPFKTPKPVTQEAETVSFFWDIENVPIPKGQKPFEIVQRIRQKLVIELGLQEADFSCYCNINTISQDNQQSLSHANVRIVHVPDRKPGAVDRLILLELDRFERSHRPPATIVLISGDIDFVGKLSDLRHRARFHVIVIHNKPAKEELKLTVNAHYPWEFFTEPSQQQQPLIGNSSDRLTDPSANYRPVLSSRLNNISNKNEPRFPNLMDLNLTPPRSDSQVGNNLRQDDDFSSNDSPPPRRPPIADQNHRPTDVAQSRKPPTPQPVKPRVILNADSSTSPSHPTSIVAPRVRIRRVVSTSQLDRQDSGASDSSVQTPSTISDDAEKKKHNPLHCEFCTNEFSTIQALRQHQKDKKHLYYCSKCKEGFPTSNSLEQHKIAKRHNVSKYTNDQSNSQFDTADNLNIHQSAVVSPHNSNILNSGNRPPVYPSPGTKYSAINRNTNYVNSVSDDED